MGNNPKRKERQKRHPYSASHPVRQVRQVRPACADRNRKNRSKPASAASWMRRERDWLSY